MHALPNTQQQVQRLNTAAGGNCTVAKEQHVATVTAGGFVYP